MELVRPRPRLNVYEQPFWDFVQNRELRLQRCLDCNAFRYPPAGICAGCLSDRSEWTVISGRGRLLAWVVFHRKYFAELPVPYTVAAVEIEEGPILLANMINQGTQPLRLDLPVRLAFETALDSSGESWLIYQWELEAAEG